MVDGAGGGMVIFTKMKIEEIASVIVERRKELRVSQAQLAEMCQISVHTMSNMEAGVGNPTLESLLKVIDVLGLQLDLSVRKLF